jgi:hypothetical protein
MLADPLCFAKRVRRNARLQIKPLFPRSEERVVERSNDRVSKYRNAKLSHYCQSEPVEDLNNMLIT